MTSAVPFYMDHKPGALSIHPKLPEIPGQLGAKETRFPEFHSEILGVPREVGLKFRKIGITGEFRSIRPFLLGPSSSEAGNRMPYQRLILKLLNIILVLYPTNNWISCFNVVAVDWPQQALVSSHKIHVSYVKNEHNRVNRVNSSLFNRK